MSKTDTVLKILASEYERSKKEQIERFLRDQEDLNHKFAEFSLHSENQKAEEDEEVNSDNSDNSDTASVFTQRLSVYKSRPHTAMGWADLDPDPIDRKSDSSDNGNILDSEEDEWKSAVASAVNIASTTKDIHKQTKRHNRHREPTRNYSKNTGHHTAQNNKPQSEGKQETHKSHVYVASNNTDTKLLTRRNVRPRTATGIQRTKHNGNRNAMNVDGENDNSESPDEVARRLRLMRASAPATVSRVRRVSWEPENTKSHFLPDTRQQNGLLHSNSPPTYASLSNNGPVSGKLHDGASQLTKLKQQNSMDSKNLIIISSMNPQLRNSKEKLNMEYQNSRQFSNKQDRSPTKKIGTSQSMMPDEPIRHSKQLAVLKLPPLEGGQGSKRSQSRSRDVENKPSDKPSRTAPQKEFEFLAG